MQEVLWQGALYFVGGGRDYIMTGEKTFVLPEEDEKLPDGAQIADHTCSLITEYDDRVRVYSTTAPKSCSMYRPCSVSKWRRAARSAM